MDENTKKILKEIEEGYDLIAEKFSATRSFFWKDLEFIADFVEPGDRVLDFGCGNGRLLEILKDKDIDYKGVDVSEKLIGKAKEKYPGLRDEFLKIEAQESLPFPEDFFNVIFSVAVFHHFPSEYQKERARELFGIIEPGGKIIITVWNLGKSNILPEKKWEIISDREAYISFKNNEGREFRRYHYIFSEEDLKIIFEEAGFRVERCDILNGRNIVLVAKK